MRRLTMLTLALATALAAAAQTLNIQQGSVITAVPAQQAGDMTYSNGGQTLTVLNKAFTVGDITKIYIDKTDVVDNTVGISYSGSSATVTIAGNVAQYVTASVSGADVTITQADPAEEITYTLQGTSANGSFTLNGTYKATVVLNGLTLTSTSGAAIDIEDGKRIDILVAEGTCNTLADAAGGAQKACFYVKGHPEFSGTGTLNVKGNARHAFRSNEYTLLKKSFGTLNVTGSASDGLHIGQYFEMRGGTVSISNVAGDGIQVEATTDATDEMNGQAIISGGTLTATTTAEDVKTLKADAAITISGGTLTLTATGAGSKGIGTNGALDITGGKVMVTTTGSVYHENYTDGSESKPNGIKADGQITISGGEVYVAAANKGINTDTGLAINGGKVLAIGSKANATNTGTQGSSTYSGVKVTGGQTLTYGSVSYTVPGIYSCSSAKILVSPAGSSASTDTKTNEYTDNSLADNHVTVTWNGTTATVGIAPNISSLVTASVSNGHVALLADAGLAEEVTYTLTGSSSDGSLYMDGDYKSSFVFNGLSLTNPDSAAVNIRDGKRISIELADGTVNSLTDGTGGTQKACLAVKGHTEFKGGGTLNLTGRTGHAFWGKEYVLLKASAGTINVLSAVGDGFNVNEYFQQDGGTLNISGVGDDGLQVSFKTDDNDQIIPTTEDEDNTALILIQGGTLNVTATATGAKGVKTEGDITFNGGDVSVRSEGQNEGSSSGGGGGNRPGGGGGWPGGGPGGGWPGGGGGSSSSTKGAKGIKADGNITINGGTIDAYSANHEAIEAKGTLVMTDGTVHAQAGDDAVNSAGDMTISGGCLYAYSTGNDGVDANGNMYLRGGVIIGFGAGGAEAGIDVAEQKKMYFTGGQIFGIGGRVDGYPTSTTGSQAYGYTTQSVSCANGGYFVLSQGNTRLFAVKVPAQYSGIVLCSSPSMVSGTSYTVGSATSVGGTVANGFVLSPTVGSVSNTKSFTARK